MTYTSGPCIMPKTVWEGFEALLKEALGKHGVHGCSLLLSEEPTPSQLCMCQVVLWLWPSWTTVCWITLSVLQNAVIEGQETPLRLTFAKDKPTERPPPTSTIASDALQVSMAVSVKKAFLSC